MRIGFDVSQTGSLKAGCGYFADSMIQRLAGLDSVNEYILYPTFGGLYWDPKWKASTRRISAPNFCVGLGHASLASHRSFWSNPDRRLEEFLGNPDIVHSNNFFCPRGLDSALLVYTLHDISFLENPEWHLEENRQGCFDGIFDAALCADMIVAVSEYSRRHFLEIFPHFPGDRIMVVHLASRFSYAPGIARPSSLSFLEPNRFWLNVGTLEPRKNQRGLLRAYARLKADARVNMPLVMAGSRGWLMDDIHRTIRELGLSRDVFLPGYVDDTQLQWLYQNCYASVYPSLFEGFGLPVLEAMSLGAPVISSNVTSIPEIVGDAGLLVDPRDEDAIFRAMLELRENRPLRERLKEQGLRRAGEFSWEKAARALLECYGACTRRQS